MIMFPLICVDSKSTFNLSLSLVSYFLLRWLYINHFKVYEKDSYIFITDV